MLLNVYIAGAIFFALQVGYRIGQGAGAYDRIPFVVYRSLLWPLWIVIKIGYIAGRAAKKGQIADRSAQAEIDRARLRQAPLDQKQPN